MSQVLGAICTYRRPGDLRTMLDALEAQSCPPDRLVVIDNDADPIINQLVSSHPIARSLPIETLAAPGNPGPAGAFALAYEHLERSAEDDDILVIFDDDDPPPSTTLLAELVDIARNAFADPTVAGVGLRGGVLDRRSGIVASRPSPGDHSTEQADHLHGGWFPCYRVSALQAVGQFDPSYFWGFEELELGRRLTAAGFQLRVASDLYFRVAEKRCTPRWNTRLPDRSWRHFYRHRNLIRILRRDRAWSALALLVGLRMLLKPLVFMLFQPRLSLWHLRTNGHAIVDGFRRTPAGAKHRRFTPD